MTTNTTSIVIAGSVVVIASAHTKAELEKVAAYKPEALQLKDKEGNTYFTLLPGCTGNATPTALVYSEVTPDGTGKACLTLPLPEGEDAKKAVAAAYGPMIANANKVEAQIADALIETNAMLADVENQITVAGAPDAENEVSVQE